MSINLTIHDAPGHILVPETSSLDAEALPRR